ncbi:MAG: VOC family protein [Flavobacteriaceae bacterium]
MKVQPFHLAIPVQNLEKCRTFYRDILQCEEGRCSEHWVDFNFFGHQFVIHQKENYQPTKAITNPVDGHNVPVPHFGVILTWKDWHNLADRLKAVNIEFIIEPTIRFKGKVGEQATMFFNDPENNALEFKAFKDMSQIFAK